jgi:ankyrin repeat protein
VLQNGVTALHAATCGCHSAVVKALLERGANINSVEQVTYLPAQLILF